MKRILVLSLAFLLAGCCGTPVAVAPASSSACAAPMAPAVAGYEIGAESYARGALAVPGEFVVCVGNFLQCALDSLWPTPVPTAVFAAAAPVAAAPCAPAPAAAPCMVTETYSVPVEETVLVPTKRVRMEQRTRQVPAQIVAPPPAAPCVPSDAPPAGAAPSAWEPAAPCCPPGCKDCGIVAASR